MKGILARGALLLGEHVLTTVVTLAVSIVALRYWGPYWSGMLAKAQVCVAITASIATLALDLSLLKRLSLPDAQPARLLGTAMALRAAAALLAGLLAALLAGLFSESAPGYGAAVLIFIAAQCMASLNVFPFFFMARERIAGLVTLRLVLALLFAGCRLLLMHSGAGILVYTAVFLCEALLLLCGCALLYRWSERRLRLAFDRSLVRPLLRENLPLVLSGLTVTAFFKIDVFVLSALRPLHDVGIYVAGLRVVEIYSSGLALVLNQAYVSLARAHAAGQAYTRQLNRMFRHALLAGGLLAVAHELMGKKLLALVLGPGYADTIALTTILVISIPVGAAGIVRSFAFSLEGLNRYHPMCALLGIACLIPLLLLLVPIWGPAGAAVALVFSQGLSVFATTLLFKPLRHLRHTQVGWWKNESTS